MLCRILKESPALRYLKLSYLNGAENQWGLEEICKQYSQLGGAPLQLEIVILGPGIYLKLPEQVNGVGASSQASYLTLLTDPTCIQEMGIIATRDTAWDTFDSAFFPNMDRFYLHASRRSEAMVNNFFAMRKARNFLRQVHFEIDGSLFRKYQEFNGMSDYFLVPADLERHAMLFSMKPGPGVVSRELSKASEVISLIRCSECSTDTRKYPERSQIVLTKVNRHDTKILWTLRPERSGVSLGPNGVFLPHNTSRRRLLSTQCRSALADHSYPRRCHPLQPPCWLFWHMSVRDVCTRALTLDRLCLQ